MWTWLFTLATAAAAPEMIPLESLEIVGRSAPTFELEMLDGESFDLESHRGKPIVLSFWASWCGPCRYELPALQVFAAAHPEVDVFAVNVDRHPAAAQKFLRTVKVDLPIIWDPDSLALGQYDVLSMPTLFLLDKNLTVKWKKVGFSREKGLTELESELAALGGPMSEKRPSALRLLALLALVLVTLTGSVISVYMARHHEVELYGGEAYASEELVGCKEDAGVSCDIVNTSEWSEVFGVPTFAWAIPTYLTVLLLTILVWRGEERHLGTITVIGLLSSLFSAWLYYVSVVELGKVCLWCMRLYGINASVLILPWLAGFRPSKLPGPDQLKPAVIAFAVVGIITVGAQKLFRAQLLADAPKIAAMQGADDGVADDDPTTDAPPALLQDHHRGRQPRPDHRAPGRRVEGQPGRARGDRGVRGLPVRLLQARELPAAAALSRLPR